MVMKVEMTAHGVVAREVLSGGEIAYRLKPDMGWDRRGNHSRPWERVDRQVVPAAFKDAIDRYCAAHDDPL